MKTLRLTVDPARVDSAEAAAVLERAAAILRGGGLVALPTETVYGLGANALDAAAVARIFEAKQRPAWDPIIVHLAGPVVHNAMLDSLVANVPEPARKLMAAFWPGPMTLLLPRSTAVPDAVTAGRPLVGVRMPSHPVAFELIRRAGVPVAAPSANLFSHTSPTTAQHVLEDLDGRIDAIVDAGPAQHGVESTVLDPNRRPMVIYRPGAVTAEQIRRVGGDVVNFQDAIHEDAVHEEGNAKDSGETRAGLPSPGVGIRHYAPRARLVLVKGPERELQRRLISAAGEFTAKNTGVMLPAGWASAPLAAQVFHWGRWDAPEELAARLYAGLRALDAAGCEVILCPVPDGGGICAAVRDRLRKAAWRQPD